MSIKDIGNKYLVCRLYLVSKQKVADLFYFVILGSLLVW